MSSELGIMIVADAELLLFAILKNGDTYGGRAAIADVAHFFCHLRLLDE